MTPLTPWQCEQVEALLPAVTRWAGADRERQSQYAEWLCDLVPQWDGQCALEAFLRRELTRRWKKRRRPLAAAADAEQPARIVDADAALDVRAALAALSPSDAAVAESLAAGRSRADTARHLNLPLYQVQRAIRRIRTCLSKCT